MDPGAVTPTIGTAGVLATQDQKLETMGRLIADIAHELSSPLQFIGHSVHLLRGAVVPAFSALEADAVAGRRGSAGRDARERRREIEQTIDDLDAGVAQATLILRAMKLLTHPGTDDAYAVSLNEAVEGAALIARQRVIRVADLSVEMGDVPPVVCFPGALQQAVVNLLVNAADAVEDSGAAPPCPRGRVDVRTQRDGDYAVISVADTGTGIPEAIRDRVFEPFFTTKQPGRGSGQGLAIVRDIVRRHGGTLALATADARGTTFTIRLPIRGPSGEHL